MKSAQINRYRGSEVSDINHNTPEPTLSSGKVLVSIKSAGVNPADWKIREGAFQQMVHLFNSPLPWGWIFLALSNKLGKGSLIRDFKHGDEVYGQAGVINGGIRSICRNGFGKD